MVLLTTGSFHQTTDKAFLSVLSSSSTWCWETNGLVWWRAGCMGRMFLDVQQTRWMS